MTAHVNLTTSQKTIQNTFTLEEIPRNALYLGAAGVLPYLATSLSTVYLAWDLNHSATHGVGVLLDAQTALLGLQILEPLQIGYGAVVSLFGPLFSPIPLSLQNSHLGNRSSPSSAPSTGAWNGPTTVPRKIQDTLSHGTSSVLSLPPSPGPQSSCQSNTP